MMENEDADIYGFLNRNDEWLKYEWLNVRQDRFFDDEFDTTHFYWSSP